MVLIELHDNFKAPSLQQVLINGWLRAAGGCRVVLRLTSKAGQVINQHSIGIQFATCVTAGGGVDFGSRTHFGTGSGSSSRRRVGRCPCEERVAGCGGRGQKATDLLMLHVALLRGEDCSATSAREDAGCHQHVLVRGQIKCHLGLQLLLQLLLLLGGQFEAAQVAERVASVRRVLAEVALAFTRLAVAARVDATVVVAVVAAAADVTVAAVVVVGAIVVE